MSSSSSSAGAKQKKVNTGPSKQASAAPKVNTGPPKQASAAPRTTSTKKTVPGNVVVLHGCAKCIIRDQRLHVVEGETTVTLPGKQPKKMTSVHHGIAWKGLRIPRGAEIEMHDVVSMVVSQNNNIGKVFSVMPWGHRVEWNV